MRFFADTRGNRSDFIFHTGISNFSGNTQVV